MDGCFSGWRLVSLGIGGLMIIISLALLIDGQALGEGTSTIATFLGLAGIMIIALINGLDVFREPKKD